MGEQETPQLSQHGSTGLFIDIEEQSYGERPVGLPRPDENVEFGVGSLTESPLV